MNELQIHYFLHLSETGNMSETARQLFVAQSAVSKQIAALEKELGFPLFHRTNRGVALTAGGRRMQAFFAETAERYRLAYSQASRTMSGHRDSLSIGIMENLGLDELQPVIQSMRAQNDQLDVSQLRLDVGTLIKRLLDGAVDVAITFDHAVDKHTGVQYAELLLEQSMFIISRAHPLARREDLRPQDLSGQIICQTVTQSGPFFDEYLYRLLKLLAIHPAGYLSVDNMASGLAAVETNYAVGLIDERSQLIHPERYRLIGSGTYQSVVVAWRTGSQNVHIPEFVALMQQACRRQSRCESGDAQMEFPQMPVEPERGI